MGEFRLPLRSDFSRNEGAKWYSCVLCGAQLTRALVHFDSGSVTPTSGETVTGATSGNTMVLNRYVLTGGTSAGGDAVGIMEGTSPSGYNSVGLELFQNDENLNGSVSGANFATVNGIGSVQISGRLIPDSEIVEHQGKYYCKSHFLFTFSQTWLDDAKIDTTKEGDRE